MSTPYFPPLTAEHLVPLRALKQLLVNSPDLLNHPNCPYDDDVREFLKLMLAPADLAKDEIISLDTPEAMDAQLEHIYSNLMKFQSELNKSDSKDKLQWAKAAISIIDRVISLKERVLNLKNFSNFQKTMIGILDDVLEPHQRTEVVERLGNFIDQESPLHEQSQ